MLRPIFPRCSGRSLGRRRIRIQNHLPQVRRLPLSSSSSSSENSHKYEFLSKLPWQFLRDLDSAKFDPVTQQRNDVPYDSSSGKPLEVEKMESEQSSAASRTRVTMKEYAIQSDNAHCEILWSDNVRTTHDLATLEHFYRRWNYQLNMDDRKRWTDLSEDDVRRSVDMSISFDALIMDQSGAGMTRGLAALYYYGILLITETPVDDDGAGIAAIGAALGGGNIKLPSNSILSTYQAGKKDLVLTTGTDGPMRTLYGSVWATSSGAQPQGTSVADSAYGSDGLPLHTDFTYQTDPPGLQIFTMVQPALEGGESVFGDGFAVAEALRSQNPDAFDILSKTIRTYHSKDELTGWNLRASGPIIKVDRGRIVSIRHNDLDRLPDLPPDGTKDSQEIDAFYDKLHDAHLAWNSLLAQDKYRLVMKLRPGDTMVVANQVSGLVAYAKTSMDRNPTLFSRQPYTFPPFLMRRGVFMAEKVSPLQQAIQELSWDAMSVKTNFLLGFAWRDSMCD